MNRRRLLLLLAALPVALIVVIFVILSLFDSPAYAWRILAYGQSDTDDIHRFPERRIQAAASPSPLPAQPEEAPTSITWLYDNQPHSEDLQKLLQRTETAAFLIIRDGKIVFQDYAEGEISTPHTSFSSAKSVNSALIGAAIADGYIGSVDDAVVEYIPEIAGRGLDNMTIRDLLLMNSGIAYELADELPLYRQPFSDDALTYYSPDLRNIALSVQASGAPIGSAFRYNNYHPLLEGLILERATGMPVAYYLQERLWKPMGAEFDASWSLDSKGSAFEKMESGINAAAVDFARFGLVFLNNGFWNGTQILSAAWVTESTGPLRPDPRVWETMQDVPRFGGYYKYHWWGLNNDDGSYDFYAHGRYDQFVYVAPRKNMVIVRLGNQPDATVNWPLAMQALVDQFPAPVAGSG